MCLSFFLFLFVLSRRHSHHPHPCVKFTTSLALKSMTKVRGAHHINGNTYWLQVVTVSHGIFSGVIICLHLKYMGKKSMSKTCIFGIELCAAY